MENGLQNGLVRLMKGDTLIAGLKGKSVDVLYTVPTINRLIESGEPGVTSGILQDVDADCIVIVTQNGTTEYLMKTAIIRIVPRE